MDTNILVTYARSNQISKSLEADLKLLEEGNDIVVSAVALGEIKSIALRNKWGDKKMIGLEVLLAKLLHANINVKTIINRYAEIDAYSQGKLISNETHFTARNMGKNDLWIAATASVLNLTLVTTDNDFDHLDGKYLKIKKVDMKKYL